MNAAAGVLVRVLPLLFLLLLLLVVLIVLFFFFFSHAVVDVVVQDSKHQQNPTREGMHWNERTPEDVYKAHYVEQEFDIQMLEINV
jgi:preprotein translocase subunit SecY